MALMLFFFPPWRVIVLCVCFVKEEGRLCVCVFNCGLLCEKREVCMCELDLQNVCVCVYIFVRVWLWVLCKGKGCVWWWGVWPTDWEQLVRKRKKEKMRPKPLSYLLLLFPFFLSHAPFLSFPFLFFSVYLQNRLSVFSVYFHPAQGNFNINT